MRSSANLRWITPVLLTINISILGYLITQIEFVKRYVDEKFEKFQDSIVEIKGDIKVIKYHVKLNQ